MSRNIGEVASKRKRASGEAAEKKDDKAKDDLGANKKSYSFVDSTKKATNRVASKRKRKGKFAGRLCEDNVAGCKLSFTKFIMKLKESFNSGEINEPIIPILHINKNLEARVYFYNAQDSSCVFEFGISRGYRSVTTMSNIATGEAEAIETMDLELYSDVPVTAEPNQVCVSEDKVKLPVKRVMQGEITYTIPLRVGGQDRFPEAKLLVGNHKGIDALLGK